MGPRFREDDIADHGYDQSRFPGAPLRRALSQADGKLKLVDTSYAANGFYHAAAAADINSDGGTGHFTEAARTTLPYPAGYGVTLDFDVADLDGDGSPEVVMNHTTLAPFYQGFRWSSAMINGRTAADTSAKWFGSVFDDGLGKCSSNCWTAETNWTKWLRLTDYDGDRKVDLLVTDKSRNLRFKNTGTTLVKQ
jgi:hypothetical protein